jgi:hypothetical protein
MVFKFFQIEPGKVCSLFVHLSFFGNILSAKKVAVSFEKLDFVGHGEVCVLTTGSQYEGQWLRASILLNAKFVLLRSGMMLVEFY